MQDSLKASQANVKGNNQIPPTPINGEELIENYPAELLQGYISDSVKPVNGLAKS